MSSKILVDGVSVEHIINKNEDRVAKILSDLLPEFRNRNFSDLDIEDIYALTLNRLSPRYLQYGSLVEKDEITDDRIRQQLQDAIKIVSKNPR